VDRCERPVTQALQQRRQGEHRAVGHLLRTVRRRPRAKSQLTDGPALDQFKMALRAMDDRQKVAGPGAYQIWVRDALGDWETQSAHALSIRRLDGATTAPLSEEHAAERAARHATDGAYYAYYCVRSIAALRANEMKPPMSSGAMGGMATQRTCRANVCLAGDEAMIITTTSGGALFATPCCRIYLCCRLTIGHGRRAST
jgi:hypothetical protein